MCQHKVLHNNKSGYVVLCGGCNQIQVAFASTLVTLNEEQFCIFSGIVDKSYKSNSHFYQRNRKTIKIPTPEATVSMILTIDELEDLQVLVSAARRQFEFERLFIFHKN